MKYHITTEGVLETRLSGFDLINFPMLNKGTTLVAQLRQYLGADLSLPIRALPVTLEIPNRNRASKAIRTELGDVYGLAVSQFAQALQNHRAKQRAAMAVRSRAASAGASAWCDSNPALRLPPLVLQFSSRSLVGPGV